VSFLRLSNKSFPENNGFARKTSGCRMDSHERQTTGVCKSREGISPPLEGCRHSDGRLQIARWQHYIQTKRSTRSRGASEGDSPDSSNVQGCPLYTTLRKRDMLRICNHTSTGNTISRCRYCVARWYRRSQYDGHSQYMSVGRLVATCGYSH
jgi:hypothetical protein